MFGFYILDVFIFGNLLYIFPCFCAWLKDFYLPFLKGTKSRRSSPNCHSKKLYKGLVSQKKNFDYEEDKEEFTEKLSIDHIFVTFPQYLWGCYFLLPNLFTAMTFGLLKMYCRLLLIYLNDLFHGTGEKQKAVKFFPMRNFIPHPEPEKLIAELMLENVTGVVHFTHKYHCEERGHDIGVFQINDFGGLVLNKQNKCAFTIYRELKVEVDLDKRECVRVLLTRDCNSGKSDINYNEGLQILWFIGIVHGHVKIHSLANWSVNLDSDRNSFDKRQSLCTVLFNYYGRKFGTIPGIMLNMLGILPCDISDLSRVFNNADSQNALPNAKCPVMKDVLNNNNNNNKEDFFGVQQQHRFAASALFQHSRHVRFIVKLRGVFMKLFEQHKLDFPGVNAEALFVGSVIHSLDHACGEAVVQDPFYLDATHEEFGLMGLVGQIVRSGFIAEPPGHMFKKRYADGEEGSFWRQVYEKASILDKDLAELLECGIVR